MNNEAGVLLSNDFWYFDSEHYSVLASSENVYCLEQLYNNILCHLTNKQRDENLYVYVDHTSELRLKKDLISPEDYREYITYCRGFVEGFKAGEYYAG